MPENDDQRIVGDKPETQPDHLGLNFEQPEPRQSTCQRFDSDWKRRLQAGEGTAALANERERESDEEVAYAMAARIAEAEGLDLSTVHEAKAREDWPKWEGAINAELQSLKEARTWDIVECPDGVNVVGCKWVFKIKKNAAGEIEKYKARLMAKGYSQIQGVDYDETYAPVARLASLRTVLAIAARNDWDIDVFDFHSTFLNGKLDEGEDIYMELLAGYKVPRSYK